MRAARMIVGMLAALVVLAPITTSAEAAPHGALRFFKEPGPPPPSGVDPLLGSCDALRLTEPIGTHKCDRARGLDHARSVDVSPDGKHVYVGSVYSGTIGVFNRNATTGDLTQLPGRDGCVDNTGDSGCANGRSLKESIFVRVSPDGKHVYATARKSDSVAVFGRNQATGELTQLPGRAGCVNERGSEGCANGRALVYAHGLALSPSGTRLYVAARGSDSVAVFERDRRSGAITQLSRRNGCITSHPTTNPGCARGRALDGAYGVTVKADRGKENVYVTSRGSDGVATFKRRSGALRQPRGSAGCITNNTTGSCLRTGRGLNGSASLAVAGNGRDVYVAAYQSFAVSRLRRDMSSPNSSSYGKLSFVSCRSEGRSTDVCTPSRGLLYAHSVVLSPDQRNVYVAGGWSNALAIFQRPRSGALNQVGPARGKTWSEGCISWRGHKW
ncbi:MAG: lactonase family protein, partial [Actinobacteria bacterium]|nr:lactonase family protein [Actinomycetota bacterium]